MLSPTKLLLFLLPLLGLLAVDTLIVGVTRGVCHDPFAQIIKIGDLNKCHNTDAFFSSVWVYDIAQSFFGRDLRFITFKNRDCQRKFEQWKLSNGLGVGVCDFSTDASALSWASFMVAHKR